MTLLGRDQELEAESRGYANRAARRAREELLALPLSTGPRDDLASQVWFATDRDAELAPVNETPHMAP